MKRFPGLAISTFLLSLSFAGVTGCGGSSSSSGTSAPPPSISSFTAASTTITAGGSTTLTGVFSGGTGVVTPGNLPATSGVAVSVSPATTTTYTLTVTPASGTPATAMATITVNPAIPPPTITSFIAASPTIMAGGSTTLTGVFSGGTGVITPGNLPATSGVAVSVSPTVSTTYTLTVTPSSGTAATATATVTVQSTVSVDLSSTGPTITDQLLGMNMAVWYDLVTNQAGILSGFQDAGIKAVRWPGGSDSDLYHWSTNTLCDGGYADANDTFANFVNDLAVPAKLDVALTANYGSNSTCTGGGEPSEAAAWVTQALADGLTVSHMTVSNEEYGNWEYDLHSTPNDPTIYAAAVVGATGYYQSIKTASPDTLVGVVVDADNAAGGWDNTVLANAKGSYDFVEYHYYPETPGQESDPFLVNQAAQNLTANLNTVKSELAKWGTPDTPIYVGEIGGPYSNPGKQSWSITQGLYAGQVLGEMMNDGTSRLTWWIGYGNCNGTSGNESSSLYGWQDFGAYNVFSDGPSETNCPGAGPLGTMSPTARAFQLFSSVAVTGQTALTANVAGDTTDVRAYAATNPSGTALVLFNNNETAPQQVVISLSAKTSSPSITVTTYDKAIYDQSQNGVWAAPTSASLTNQSLPLTITLSPWSMNVFIIK